MKVNLTFSGDGHKSQVVERDDSIVLRGYGQVVLGLFWSELKKDDTYSGFWIFLMGFLGYFISESLSGAKGRAKSSAHLGYFSLKHSSSLH